MKTNILTLMVLLALGGLFYGLGVVPSSFRGKGGAADGRQGKERPRNGERAVTVQVSRVTAGESEEKMSYIGSLVAQSSVDIFSKVEGRLEKVLVDIGSWVKEGDLIAQIEEEEIVQSVREAEASLQVARATLKGKEAEMKNLKRQAERAKVLFEKSLIARQELDSIETQHYSALAQTELARAQIAQREALLENARIRLRHTRVRSPIAGYVGRRFLDRGAMVKTNIPIASLVDIDPVKTLISAVETDYRRIRPGLPAAITVDAYPGETFTGKVVRVSPLLDKDTRTADIEIEIPNPRKVLKPGMFARVALTVRKKERSLVVPEAALVRREDTVGVYRLDPEGRRANFVRLEIGASQGGKVEVVRGVAEGDRVVTLGAHLLKEGSQVRVVNSPGSE